MDYANLGYPGLKVSRLCPGRMSRRGSTTCAFLPSRLAFNDAENTSEFRNGMDAATEDADKKVVRMHIVRQGATVAAAAHFLKLSPGATAAFEGVAIPPPVLEFS
jgi:hypothetical protein